MQVKANKEIIKEKRYLKIQNERQEFAGLPIYTAIDLDDDLVTFGGNDCDYDTAQKFVLDQVANMNDLNKFANYIMLDTSKELLEEFFENANNTEYWNALAEDCFDAEYMGR